MDEQKQKTVELLKKYLEDINFSVREKKIMSMRWGLKDGRQMTLEAVGREFGITRARVWQIQSSVLEKIKGLNK